MTRLRLTPEQPSQPVPDESRAEGRTESGRIAGVVNLGSDTYWSADYRWQQLTITDHGVRERQRPPIATPASVNGGPSVEQ